jgi:hypothetical protein
MDLCLLNCGLRSTGGPRRFAGGFGRKPIATIVSDTERIKKETLFVNLQQKLGELVFYFP